MEVACDQFIILTTETERFLLHFFFFFRDMPRERFKLLDSFLSQFESGLPVAYILSKQAFWKRDSFFVETSKCLIPRPETELLVECALEIANEHFNFQRGSQTQEILGKQRKSI